MSDYLAVHQELNLLNPESHRVFRELIENMRAALFMTDASGRLFYVNHSFNELFGFPNRTHSTGLNWDHILFPDPKRRAVFQEKLRIGGSVVNEEVAYRNVLGVDLFLSLTVDSIRNDQGEVIGLRGAIVDISERRSLEEKLRSEELKLQEVIAFYNTLNNFKDPEALNTYIVSQTAKVLEASRCSLMILDAPREELLIKAAFGFSHKALSHVRVKLGAPVSGLAAIRGQAVLVNNIESHDLFKRPKGKEYVSGGFMCAPLFHETKLVGIINIADKKGCFTPGDLKVFETIATQASFSICKMQALNDFEHLSRVDPMTGLLNYRCFVQRLEEEMARSTRYGQAFSLMMVDVDNFKPYNDTHGHPGGDALLRYLAETFKTHLRSTDFIFRYGGDEFAMILPNTDCTQAAVAGENIREKVVRDCLKDKVSLSIGVAQFRPGVAREALVKQADQALYRAKESGRNRVFISRF